jgi:hypothetical protein
MRFMVKCSIIKSRNPKQFHYRIYFVRLTFTQSPDAYVSSIDMVWYMCESRYKREKETEQVVGNSGEQKRIEKLPTTSTSKRNKKATNHVEYVRSIPRDVSVAIGQSVEAVGIGRHLEGLNRR